MIIPAVQKPVSFL